MGGFCGWHGAFSGSLDTREVLAAMLGSRVEEAPVDLRISVTAGALAAWRSIVPSDIHYAAPLIVGVAGRVQWRSPELASHAREHGAAAAVAEAYRRHGAECLEVIGGNFALAALDVRDGSALLAVDRMGMGTLCFANPRGLVVFGSNAEAVAAHPSVGGRLSEQGVFNYLYCHMVPSPGTVYSAVQKLQPGECVVFRNGVAERRFYWRMRYSDRAAESMEALEAKFRRLLRDSAQRAVDGDAQVGAFLSGGTDSSTVAGLLTELRGTPARTYSIGFKAAGFDEMEYARVTARHFRADAHEYYVTPQDVAEAIPQVAQAYDEPFGNASAVPTLLCARMAKADGVQVMLAGDGGDEIFGGNARYATQRVFQAYGRLPRALRRGLIEPVMAATAAGDALPPWRKLRSYISQATAPLPDRLETYNFLRRAPLDAIFEPDFLRQVNPEEPLELQRAAYERAAASSYIDRMMHLDLKFTLADNDLRKVTRMCELAGVEVRYPLIDDALVAFSGELPAELKVKGLKLRYFFKHALRDFLPPQTIAKKKHGFGLPFGVWLKEHPPLRALALDSVNAFGRRGILRPAYVSDLLRQHEIGHATYYGVMIWVVMMLEQWLAARGR